MTSGEACSHIEAITGIKRARTHECDECVRIRCYPDEAHAHY